MPGITKQPPEVIVNFFSVSVSFCMFSCSTGYLIRAYLVLIKWPYIKQFYVRDFELNIQKDFNFHFAFFFLQLKKISKVFFLQFFCFLFPFFVFFSTKSQIHQIRLRFIIDQLRKCREIIFRLDREVRIHLHTYLL